MELTINVKGEEHKVFGYYSNQFKREEILLSNVKADSFYGEVPERGKELFDKHIDRLITAIEENPIPFFEEKSYMGMAFHK